MMYIIGTLIYIIIIVLIVFIFFYVLKNSNFKFIKKRNLAPPTIKQKIIWGFTIVQFILIFPLLVVSCTLLVIVIQKELIIPDDVLLYIITNDMYIFSIAWLFISIPLTGIILMLFHHMDYDYVAEYKGQPTGRIEENFFPLMIMLLVVFILAFPFCVLGVGDYFYFTETYVGTDRFWSLAEKQYQYSNINEVTVRYKKNNDKDFEFYYEIYFNDNSSEDIFMDRSNDINRADEILRSKGVKIKRDTISIEDYNAIKKSYTDDFSELIAKIFYIGNN